MFKTLKKVTNALTSGIANAVKNAVYKPIDDFDALIKKADPKLYSTITDVVLDEVAKQSHIAPSFKVIIGRYDKEMADIRNHFMREVKYLQIEKAGKLTKFEVINALIDFQAVYASRAYTSALMGLTQSQEKCGQDVIMFFPEVIAHAWKFTAGNDGTHTFEETVRAIVRHEFRHAQQILYIRKKYGSDAVAAVLKNEGNYAYGKGPMESDAMSGEFADYGPIEEWDPKLF